MSPEAFEERRQRIRELVLEKERARLERKGLAEKIDRNLFRSPLTDDPEDESDDILDNCYVREPKNHKYTLIWLHSIMEDNSKARTMLQMISPEDVRVVVPNAPKIPITALDERDERAWWDIEFENSQGNPEDEEDTIGIEESHKELIKLLELEEGIIGSENIILGGFGQGAALALYTALRYPVPLRGVMMWAGYVVGQENLPEDISDANFETKVLAYQGKADDIVNPTTALDGIKTLKSYGVPVEIRLVARMGHFVDQHQWVQGYDWCMRNFHSGPKSS